MTRAEPEILNIMSRRGYNAPYELGHEPRDPGLPWRLAQGVGGGGGARASPPAPLSTRQLPLSARRSDRAFYRGKRLAPIRNWSIARAHCRPSRIAQTTSDWPRRLSPAANSLGTEVR